jgi:hypothetical protein
MAELPGHHLRVLAGLQRHGRPAVPEIVEPDRWQAEAGRPALERDRHRVRVQRLTTRAGEHPTVVAVPGAEGQPLGCLLFAVDPEDGDGGRVQLDPAAAGGGLGPPDREVAAVQVDVRPLQSGQLADTHAGGRGELVQSGQPVAGHTVKESAELVGRPGREDPVSGLRRVDEIRRVAGQQVPADCVD